MRTSPAAAPTRAAVLLIVCFLLTSLPGRADTKARAASAEEIHQLVEDLGNARFPVRQRASERLKAVGLDALPALQKATENADPEVRQRAWRLIDGWAAEGKVPALLFQLSNENGSIRANAAENLGKLGAAAKPAIPALTQAAQDGSELVRCCAREALKTIQSVAEITVEVVNLDPDAKVGANQRFQIEVSNSGTAPATNLRFEGQVPAHLTLTGGIGVDFRRDGQRIITVPLELAPNSKVRLELCCKVTRKAAEPFRVEVRADQLANPLNGGDNLPAQTVSGTPRPAGQGGSGNDMSTPIPPPVVPITPPAEGPPTKPQK